MKQENAKNALSPSSRSSSFISRQIIKDSPLPVVLHIGSLTPLSVLKAKIEKKKAERPAKEKQRKESELARSAMTKAKPDKNLKRLKADEKFLDALMEKFTEDAAQQTGFKFQIGSASGGTDANHGNGKILFDGAPKSIFPFL